MKILIAGTGYVGLVTGTCFSEVGIDVTCVDIDKTKVENLRKAIVSIYEPMLEPMVKRNIEKGRLHFSDDLSSSIDDCEVIFCAVGTPPEEDGSADLRHVLDVAKKIGKNINNYILVATKSTVPVGTAQKIKTTIQKELDIRKKNIAFDVVSNPEFLKEGNAVEDFLKPDRIIVGAESERAKDIIRKLYKPFTLNGHPIIFMDILSAEMTKYTANAMLATKISFINDIANLCEITGADVNMVRKGIGSDTRIGNKFIYPGIGYGGSCFPKDVKALIKTAKKNNYQLKVLQAVEDVNEKQKSILFYKALKFFNNNLKNKTIALWGLSFKPKTNDMREAPSLIIIKKLIDAGANIKVYDPIAIEEAKHIIGNKVEYTNDLYQTITNADCLMLITESSEFRFPDYQKMKKIMKRPVIFDGRNIYDKNVMKENGFIYFCIGVKTKY